ARTGITCGGITCPGITTMMMIGAIEPYLAPRYVRSAAARRNRSQSQTFTKRRDFGDSTGANAMAPPATTLDTRETEFLIDSDKVEGTKVYRSNGDKIGQIERLMIDKISGKVAYAVMSFGGFLGLGEDYYPVPWSLLTYNRELGGYDVDISDEQLKAAPKYG